MIEKQYQLINEELQKPEVISDVKKMTEMMKKLRSLEDTVSKYQEYKETQQAIADLKELVNDEDPEIRELAKIDLDNENQKLIKLEEELKILLLPKDPNDERNVIVEIRLQRAKPIFLPGIFSGCIHAMRKKRVGNWKFWTQMSPNSGASR